MLFFIKVIMIWEICFFSSLFKFVVWYFLRLQNWFGIKSNKLDNNSSFLIHEILTIVNLFSNHLLTNLVINLTGLEIYLLAIKFKNNDKIKNIHHINRLTDIKFFK